MNLLACLVPLVCAAVVSVSGGGCAFYGHSCLGAHGKRSSWSPDETSVPFDEPDISAPLDAPSLNAAPVDDEPDRVAFNIIPERFTFVASGYDD